MYTVLADCDKLEGKENASGVIGGHLFMETERTVSVTRSFVTIPVLSLNTFLCCVLKCVSRYFVRYHHSLCAHLICISLPDIDRLLFDLWFYDSEKSLMQLLPLLIRRPQSRPAAELSGLSCPIFCWLGFILHDDSPHTLSNHKPPQLCQQLSL